MPAILPLNNVWYTVFHDQFSRDRMYRAIAYIDYGETADGQLLFITESGLTYGIPMQQAIAVDAQSYSAPAPDEYQAMTLPRVLPNPNRKHGKGGTAVSSN